MTAPQDHRPERIIPDIRGVSHIENQLIMAAGRQHSDTFNNTHSILQYYWSFLISADESVFCSVWFLSQIQQSLWLAMLSALRRHLVQTHLMIRHSLESGVLACYALHKKELAEFCPLCRVGDVEMVVPDDNVLSRAYSWMEAEYQSDSEIIKTMKSEINRMSAHANIASASLNIQYDNEKKEIIKDMFDSEDALNTERSLWWIGNVAVRFMFLYAKILNKYPFAAKIRLDFPEKMKVLEAEHLRIHKRLRDGFDPILLQNAGKKPVRIRAPK
ncbi:MAG: hypothetical protein WCP86_02200 [bacterium]